MRAHRRRWAYGLLSFAGTGLVWMGIPLDGLAGIGCSLAGLACFVCAARILRGRALPRPRNLVTVAAALYIAAVVWSAWHVALSTFNWLLATTVVPMVWLIGALAHWSAYQHSRRWARDVEAVHGPAPERSRTGVR